ncbi:MAG: radical SAM protein [Geobacter sp.]|nr:radical SAM protein [Geobacter sp.]
MRLTLVAIHPERSPQSVPLAAAFLAAAVKERFSGAVLVTILDLYADQTAAECAALIDRSNPDLAGFSVYVWNRALANEVAAALKVVRPQVSLFCGGPEATADSARLKSEAPWDTVVTGEGEAALVALVSTRLGQKEHAPGAADAPADSSARSLDHLPSPFLSGTIDPARYNGMLWQISRGCSFGCEFCYDGGGNRTVRRFSLERVAAELRWLARSGIQQVFVLDSTFNSARQRAVAILKLIRKIAPRIHFHFEVRSEFLDQQQAELFAGITCSLQIGLQSGSSEVLKSVGRSFNRADFVAKAGLLNESGAVFGFDLIYGLPGDSFDGFLESLDFSLKLMPNHLDIFPLALLPGTLLAGRADELGLRHLPQPPYTLIATPAFPAPQMARAARVANACDIFYSRGKAVSWFMTLATALQLKPSVLLLAFADYLDGEQTGEDLGDEEIFRLQCGFITRLFTENKAKKLLPLALDLISYNYHYAAALLATPPPLPTRRQLERLEPVKLRLRLAPSARLATFNYEILELLELESGDLRGMAANLAKSGSTAVIYPKQGEVLTESLHPAYVRLLRELDGRRPAGEVAAACGLAPADAADFLTFALAEGLLLV